MWLELALLGALLGLVIYLSATNKNDFFKKRGIPYDEPKSLVRTLWEMTMRKKSFFELVMELYDKHDGKIFGFFEQNEPILMIRDPELIKKVLVKDFDHFVNHRTMFNCNEDCGCSGANLFANSLVSMQEGKWKDMRNTLSPVFTGSKMRQMFRLMSDVARKTSDIFKSEAAKAPEGLELDVKDYFTRFTNDVIASTAFGVQVDSLQQRDNEFYKMGKQLTTFTTWRSLKFLLFLTFRNWTKWLNMDFFDKQSTEYFYKLVLDAMKYRKEHNIVRPDMINMLLEARDMNKSEHAKSHHRDWTDIEIVAQCFLFFFAGFENSAVLMCLTAHELMENPEVQARLYEEVKEVHRQLNDNELTYEALMGMKYMDMVTSEVLRKWPVALALDRECTKDIVYEVDGKNIEIKRGELIWISLCGIQHDPKYYENPKKFDPERFSDENKHKINPFTYMPFGLGPRLCIASRFALLEAKAVIYYLIRDFRIEPAKKSSIPIKLAAKGFQFAPENGFWLKFTARN